MNSNVLEFSKSIGKLQTVISLLHNGLKKKVVSILKQEKLNNEIKEFKKLDFSKCARFINEKWLVFSKHFDPDFKKLSKRSIEIRNRISHQDISKIDFERDLETLIKFATLIDSNELKNQIKIIINDQQSSEDLQNKSSEWYEMKEIGNEHFKIGNFTEALIFYTKSIKSDNKQASLYSNRALCELKLEKFELARQDAEDAIDLEPNNVKYYRILSEALMKLELYDESIKICELGLEIDSYEETLLLRKRDLPSRIMQKITDLNNPRKDFKDIENEIQERLPKYVQTLSNLNPRPCDIETFDRFEQFSDKMKLTQLVKDAHSYFNGVRGKNKDIRKAIEIFEHAANNGNAEGMYNLGVIYGREITGIVDYSRMLKYFKLAASQKAFYKINENIFYNIGVSEAENGLGNSYRDGGGVDIDFKKAFNHYLRSAEFGCPEGQNNVGFCLKNGYGVKTNHEYAREWFRKAAEQNIAEAQLNYAEMLENGEGGPIKESEAIEYYKKAAEQGSPSALARLQSLAFANKSYSTTLTETINKTEQKKCVNTIYLKALNYYQGSFGYEKNLDLAYKFFKQAADQDHIESIVAIFSLLINDLKRNKEAFEYCLIAAERGILDAQNELYKLYVYGHGCIRDEEKAKRWYMRTKKLKKNSNIEFDIDYKEYYEEIFEKKVKIGKELCDFEEKSSINAEGLTIKERLERMLKSVNPNAKSNKIFDFSEKEKTSLESKPISKSSVLESIADCLPILITKAENGSITAQNYLTSLKMYMEADKLIFEKKYEKAIQILRESIKFNDVLTFDYKNLSQILEIIDKNNINGKFIKARILGNDIKGSISFMQRCVKQHSNEADFHHLLGCMYAFDKNYRGALIQFERALELEYRTDWLYDKATAMRYVYFKKEDLIKIVKAYQIFLDSNPPDHRKAPEAFYSIALCYLVIKDFSTARVYWEKANDSELDRLPCFRPVEDDFMPKASLDLYFLKKIIANDPKSCSLCGEKAPKFKCPCKNAFYCDSNCQKLNWMHHKKECNIKEP